MTSNDGAASDPRDDILEHLPSMRAFAMSLTRNRSSADDLVHDSIVKAWKNLTSTTRHEPARVVSPFAQHVYSQRRKPTRSADVDGALAATLSVTAT